MKTENYLTLCLEQAALSPLHYRHGCIVVRGGKVIGRGFNDYRPGFDGGALKSGRLAYDAVDASTIAELKRKRKLKSKPKSNSTNFVPFEGTGGGPHANVPLSMHSEMMAIHSALAASSTLASSTLSSQKPSFKLSGPSKRKTRLRNEALKSYVERVCADAVQQSAQQCATRSSAAERAAADQRRGKAQVQDWRIEAGSFGSGWAVRGEQQKGERGGGQQQRQ
jgi:Cytidine and deoxycytidylate deaminase zinc-binding region